MMARVGEILSGREDPRRIIAARQKGPKTAEFTNGTSAAVHVLGHNFGHNSSAALPKSYSPGEPSEWQQSAKGGH